MEDHGFNRIAKLREEGAEGAVETAMNAKSSIERQMVGHSSALAAFIREGKRAFDLDKHDRIQDAVLQNVDVDNVEGTLYHIGNPTVQDIAARMDLYEPLLTPEQLRFMNGLRDRFEGGTVWEHDGVRRTMPGWNTILREGLPKWDPGRVRPDVRPGGFYLTRGPAKAQGAANQSGFNDLIDSLSARPAPALNRRIIAQNKARSKSMGNAMEQGGGYDNLEDALVGHINDVAKKLSDINIGKVIRTSNRRLPRERDAAGNLKPRGTRKAKDILDAPGGIPGLSDDTFVDDALADSLRRHLGRTGVSRITEWRVIRNINQIYRGLKATADFSALGIHGAFAAFRDPVMWGKAAKTSFRAFFSRDNVGVADAMLEAADDMARVQGLATSDFWSTKGLHIGGFGTEYGIPAMRRVAMGEKPVRLLGRNVPLVRQAAQLFERFNLAFGTFGDALRLDWANKLLRNELKKGKTIQDLATVNPATGRSQMQEMASIANKLTGWSERRFGGDLGDLLLFAPRYFQSRLESYGQAISGIGRYAGRPLGVEQTIQGREAARTIVQTLGTAAFLTEMINYITGHETDRRPWIDGRPNSNFYTIRYGDQDFSLFGPSIGFFQAIANVATGHPERAMRSLGSGSSRIIWDNFWSGYTFTGDEALLTRDEEGNRRFAPDRLLPYIAELTIPIAPGQALEQVVGVAQQVPGAIEQVFGEEPEEGYMGPSPVERVIGGTAAVAAETIGGRVSPMSRSDWQNEVARDKFGETYEELDATVKPLVDAIVSERYGEPAYRGPKGHLYEKVDNVKVRFLEGIQKIVDQRLSAPPGSEQFNPEIARKGTQGMTGYNKLRENRMIELYGTWNSEKGRRSGGLHDRLYDMDEEREEPEEGTREHLVWQYYKVFEEATDPDTGQVDWDEYEKGISQFWSALAEEDLDELLANIRVIEGEYPEEVSTMVDAGRYASSLKLQILGEEVTYYDLEKHPRVVKLIAAKSGVDEEQVREYLDLPFLERKSRKAHTKLGERIGKAIDKESRENGMIWTMRERFVRNAPSEWVWAMFDAGYNYGGRGEKINKSLKQRMRAGSPKPVYDYDALYRESLRLNIGIINN